MSCPDLDQVMAPEHAAHVAGCEACALLVELAHERAAALACARFEDLLAVRGALPVEDAAALEAHLAGCVACRAIASTLAPVDAVRPMTLPTIDTTMYSFGREVARGGMGRVVAAHDLRIGRPVAVKELLGSSPSTAARFEREARITARLQHPGIVPIYEIGTWPDGTPFYAMRMVEGSTLSAALADAENRLALLPAVIAAAEAVAFAHAHDVIHRDLKPSNIMVGAFGETVVIDWGLAKELGVDDPAPDAGPYRDQPEASGLTAVGEVMGTAAYMPPEQAAGDAVDCRADVYALGAILYHLLAGIAPYKGATSLEIVEKVKSEVPAPLPADAPRDLASIVAKAMARDPSARYPSARELAEELQRFQTGRVVEAHAYSRAELLRRWLRRHRAAVIGGVAALVALIVAGSIGIAGVLRERDNAHAHEAKEHAIATALLEEQGRQELLAGHDVRALAYLDAAMQQGLDTPALRFLLARALPNVEGERREFDCGGDAFVVASSRDGSRLAATCGSEIAAWDLATGNLAFRVPIQGAVNVVLSRDGGLMLAQGATTLLVDRTGHVIGQLGGSSTFGGFSDDAARVVVVHRDGVARVYATSTGAELRSLGAPLPRIGSSFGAVSRDGRTVMIAHTDGDVAIYDTETGSQIASYEHGRQIVGADLADDGRTGVTCGSNHRATVWRAGEVLRSIDAYRTPVTSCNLSRDGTRVVVTASGEQPGVWDTGSGHRIASFRDAVVATPAFSSDGRRVAIRGLHEVRLYAADTGAELGSTELSDRFGGVAFSPSGETIFVTNGSRVMAWRPRVPRRASVVPPGDDLVLEASADGTRVITQRRDGQLTLWNAETGAALSHERLVAVPRIDAARWFADLFSGDGKRMATWNGSDAVAIVDTTTGRTVASVPATRMPRVQLDQHGRHVLVEEDDAPRVWDVDRGVEVVRLSGEAHATGLAPDGRSLLTWTDPTKVDVLELDRSAVRCSFHVNGQFGWIAYDPSGQRMLVSEQGGLFGSSIYALYDATTCSRLRATSATAISFDAAGGRVLASDDEHVEIWSAVDGGLIRDLHVTAPVAALDSDGDLLASWTTGGVSILSAIDGRLLARIDSDRVISELTTDNWFYTMAVQPHWVGTGHELVALPGHSAIWNLELERRDAAAIHALVTARVPWRVVDGALVALRGRIEGRIVRGTLPPRVVALRAPDRQPYEAPVAEDGTFALTNLPFGAYQVNAGGAAVPANVTGLEPVRIDLTAP